MITVRKCALTDAETLYRLNTEVMGYPYPLEDTVETLGRLLQNTGHGIYVAEIDGQIAGYIHLQDYQTLYFAPMKNILCLAVFPEFRRNGVASALLATGNNWAKENGAAGIRLDSGAERLPAHACYEKAGYMARKMHKNFVKKFS